MRTVFLFSGQGSQYRQMGCDLFNSNDCFRRHMLRFDELIRAANGLSLVDALYGTGPFECLPLTHPGIVAIQLSLAQVLADLGIHADLVTGSSLGELAAAAASGIMNPEAAVQSALAQAAIVEEHVAPGAMIAVLGERETCSVAQTCEVHLASVNFPAHRTYAGTVDAVARFQKRLQSLGLTTVVLPVHFAFHSPHLEPAYEAYTSYLGTLKLAPASGPRFFSNLLVRELVVLPSDYFWNVARMPSDFSLAVSFLEEKGPNHFIDLSPSGTMGTFVRYNLKPHSPSRVSTVMTPYHVAQKRLKELAGSFSIQPKAI